MMIMGSQRLKPPKLPNRPPAVEQRHIHVEQCEIAGPSAKDSERLDAIAGGDDFVTFRREDRVQAGAHGIIVVHDEDSFAVGSFSGNG